MVLYRRLCPTVECELDEEEEEEEGVRAESRDRRDEPRGREEKKAESGRCFSALTMDTDGTVVTSVVELRCSGASAL